MFQPHYLREVRHVLALRALGEFDCVVVGHQVADARGRFLRVFHKKMWCTFRGLVLVLAKLHANTISRQVSACEIYPQRRVRRGKPCISETKFFG